MADPVAFKQEDDLVIVALKVPAGTKNRAIDVKFAETSVVASLHGAPAPLLQGNLSHPIQPKTSMWTLEGETLSLYLQKQDEAVKWASLFKA